MTESKSSPTPTPTPAPTTPSVLDCFDTQFSKLTDTITEHNSSTKLLTEQLKQLHKLYKSSNKQPSKQKQNTLHSLSTDLCTFLKLDNEKSLTKADAMKGVSEYIKQNNLQVVENKRRFTPDKTMCDLFNISSAKSYTFVEIGGHLTSHLTKLECTK